MISLKTYNTFVSAVVDAGDNLVQSNRVMILDVQQIILIAFEVPELDSALKGARGQDVFSHGDDTTSSIATTQFGLFRENVHGKK